MIRGLLLLATGAARGQFRSQSRKDKVKTRQQYMDGEVSHNDYYRQFVTQRILLGVETKIGLPAIQRSKDKHLNDIPLHKWDAFQPLVREECTTALKAAGDFLSLSVTVCITKQAARMLLEGVAK